MLIRENDEVRVLNMILFSRWEKKLWVKKQFKKVKKGQTRTNKKRTSGVKANTVVEPTPITSEKKTDVKPVEVPKKTTTVEPKETSEKLLLLNQHQL